MNYDRISRVNRGITQKMFLLDRTGKREYAVMGSTGRVYHIQIENTITCTCPDYTTRYRRCKHIYFILGKVLKVDNLEQKTFTRTDLDRLDNVIRKRELNNEEQKWLNNYHTHNSNQSNTESKEVPQKPLDKTSVCAICLEDMTKDQDLVYCKNTCGNSVHSDCFKQYIKYKKKEICVYCRTSWSISLENDYLNIL